MKSVRLHAGVLLAASVAALIAACSGATGDDADPIGDAEADIDTELDAEPIELTYWTWVPGVTDAVDTWNTNNPDVQIVLEQIAPGATGGYAKIFQALTAGNAPCLANIEHHQLPAYIIENGVLDINQYGAEQYRDLFTDWLWDRNLFGDALYGIPNSSGPLALFYRSDVFEALELDAPETWNDFRAAAERINQNDSATYISTFPPNAAWFSGLAEQAGAAWFRVDGEEWIVDIDSAETRDVAEYWQGLVDNGLVKTIPFTNDAWYADLQAGNIVGWIGPNWGAALLAGNAPETSGNWRVAHMPQWAAGEQVSGNWGGSATAVLNGCEHPEEAVEFAVWLQSDPGSLEPLLAGGSGWPAVKDLSEVPTASEENTFYGGQAVNELFREANERINKDWRWGPTTPSTFEFLNDEMQAAFNGEITLTEALENAQERTVNDLEDKGLPVRR